MTDRYGGQLGHGAVRQICLAHLLRGATYAIDEGDAGFALGCCGLWRSVGDAMR